MLQNQKSEPEFEPKCSKKVSKFGEFYPSKIEMICFPHYYCAKICTQTKTALGPQTDWSTTPSSMMLGCYEPWWGSQNKVQGKWAQHPTQAIMNASMRILSVQLLKLAEDLVFVWIFIFLVHVPNLLVWTSVVKVSYNYCGP